MQNIKPKPLSLASTCGASAASVLNRVIAIAPTPLLPGEKQTDYATVAERIVGAASPRDAIEELLVRDVIDLTWEVFRLRRTKVGVLNASMSDGVEDVLDGLGHGGYTKQLGQSWRARDKQARKEVEAALNRARLTIEEVTAKTIESKLDSFERLDRVLASAEARRNNALREIDRHRDVLGADVRRSVEQIEDAEFRDVETGGVTAAAQP